MITTAFLLRRSWLAASIAVICLALSVPAAAQGPVGTFERTLKVSGSADVSVQSGSGSIRVEPGAVDSVRVAARIKAGSSWLVGGDVEKRVRQIEQNPPIEQQGNVIRIGWFADDDLPRNISITYEITVPAATKLAARTGSGSIVVGAIAGPVEVKSGSGSLTVGRVGAQVAASTGSGSIRVEGAGGLEASTGSGSIHAASVAGPTKATSGSGSITIMTARPSGPWTLHASSGRHHDDRAAGTLPLTDAGRPDQLRQHRLGAPGDDGGDREDRQAPHRGQGPRRRAAHRSVLRLG